MFKPVGSADLGIQWLTSVYNWVIDFFQDHAHCTKYAGIVSAIATIHASVIQGSALGPASYTVTAADLHPVHDENRTFKFADDTYLVVPAINTDTCQEEIDHHSANVGC